MADPVTIAVIGPGAIGSTVAAWLARVPQNEVSLCARTPLNDLMVETPSGTITARPAVMTDPAAARPVDWALVCTKAYDVAGAAAWLAKLMDEGTRVAVLQNGVEHVARFAAHAPSEQIVPVMVHIPAERAAPGRVRQRAAGQLAVPEGPHAASFVALFEGTALTATVDPDFLTTVWRKLAMNCAGAVNALTLKPHGVSHDPEIAALMRGLVEECVAVGRAEGAALDESEIDWVIDHYRASPPDAVNSIHADRLAGRPMEWDARNGVIARLGEKHGIETPLNALAATILRAAQ